GVPPFNGLPDQAIIIEISHNRREKAIENTPPSYADLYMKCWSSNPDLRPTLKEILTELENLSVETDKFIINPIDNHQIQNNISLYYPDSVSSPIESSEQTSYRKKHVELLNGNLVIDCPLPANLFVNVNQRASKEFTHLRYTACTCAPEAFKEKNFRLRQIEYKPPRQTELFILINMRDENEIAMSHTLYGIMENISYLCSLENSQMWSKDGWEKVVVCIIYDSRNNINERVLSYLTALGVYQNNVAKEKVDNKAVETHIYEYTTSISINHFKDNFEMKKEADGIVPTQLLFCLTERSKPGVNSYQWFFNAFCPMLEPKICVLIDAGVKPGYGSLYNLWKAFSVNPKVADKPFESAFGYISVLSEGFSAYRYLSLQNCIGGTFINSILSNNKYTHKKHTLNFDLVTKSNNSWIFHYVKSAQAEKDAPETIINKPQR
ncbi:3522_t:CDS:2, partial [Racocetra persica]